MSSKQASGSSADKFVTSSFSIELGQVLEERSSRIRAILQSEKAVNRGELTRFIWGTGRAVRQCIKPDIDDAERRHGWQDAKGMLKDIIDWEKFTPAQYNEDCAKAVLEKKVAEVIENYKHFVMTGEIQTRHPPPKLLGETDQILVVDKPCNYTCSYGGGKKDGDDRGEVPELNWNAKTPSALLNGASKFIQIHQYLALKFNYETAIETRKWWDTNCKELPCKKGNCGSCEECACIQSGCCHRLDKETSGVLVVSKTKTGFVELREQFKSSHALEEGGIEKYYVALAHGEVKRGPDKDEQKGDEWKHTKEGGKGRVEIAEFVDNKAGRAYCYNNPSSKYDQDHLDKRPSSKTGKDRQGALTFYEPIAWFTRSEDNQKYTFVYVRIITGRYHQIRFHMSEVGHPLVGDPRYGAPWSDREWAKRVFLHSYTSKFREPQTWKWYQAISPLPPDLGAVLAHESFKLDSVNEAFFSARGADRLLLSRRVHPSLNAIMKQYDTNRRLLWAHEAVELTAQAAKQLQRTVPQTVAPPAASGGAPAGHQASSPSKPAPAPSPKSGEDGWGGDWKDWKNDADGDAGWKNGDWKNGDDWNSWKGSGSWSGEASWQQQAKPEAKLEIKPVAKAEAKPKSAFLDEDDDDDWGGWSGPAASKTQAASPGDKRPAPAAPEAEPPAQRPRVESPSPRPQAAAPKAAAAPAGVAPSTPPTSRPPAAPQVKWQRMESRSSPGIFYYWDQASGQTMAEPPPPWEKKQSRSRADVFYYWNSVTNLTSVVKPEV